MSLLAGDLKAFLETDTTIGALVDDRCYPQVLPQKPTLPAIVYSQASGVRVYDLGGADGKARLRVTVHSWATTHAGAHALADAVRARLSGFYGWMRDSKIGSVILDNEFDLNDEEAGTVGLFRVVQDYIVAVLED